MNQEILKAHALVAQKKLRPDDFDALLIGLIVGNRRVDYRTERKDNNVENQIQGDRQSHEKATPKTS